MSSMKSPDSSRRVQTVSFELTDDAYPFVNISAEEQCQVELERMLPREDGQYTEIFNIVGADPNRVMSLTADNDLVDPTVLVTRDDGGLFEFVASMGCPACFLTELGAIPREVESTNGTGRIVTEVLPGYDAGELVNSFLEEHPSAELIAKRGKDHETPLFAERDLEQALNEQLTERQRQILQTAYEAGYYERPRRMTGQDLAEALGISTATFSQHIRTAEQNLLALVNGESRA